MATWTNLSAAFGYGTTLTSAQQGQLRDNITAAFEKAGGAPVLANDYVVRAMITSGAVGSVEIGAKEIDTIHISSGAIGAAEINIRAVGSAQLDQNQVTDGHMDSNLESVTMNNIVAGSNFYKIIVSNGVITSVVESHAP